MHGCVMDCGWIVDGTTVDCRWDDIRRPENGHADTYTHQTKRREFCFGGEGPRTSGEPPKKQKLHQKARGRSGGRCGRRGRRTAAVGRRSDDAVGRGAQRPPDGGRGHAACSKRTPPDPPSGQVLRPPGGPATPAQGPGSRVLGPAHPPQRLLPYAAGPPPPTCEGQRMGGDGVEHQLGVKRPGLPPVQAPLRPIPLPGGRFTGQHSHGPRASTC